MDQLIENLQAIVGRDAVLSAPDELIVYECDGLPQHKYRPRAVVFPSSTEETSAVMRVLAGAGVPFTPRGAGTGLSGGALALDRGVVIEMARMREVLDIDVDNRTARVQPGVVNAHVSRATAKYGLHYVPDPSSQGTCTIGGNIAESAGGIHCLKYGTTTDHVLGLRVVLAGGEIVDLGTPNGEQCSYDLVGVFVGSEGTFGIATEATLRLVPVPPAVRTLLAEFGEVNDASHAVSAIIAAGVMPAALEMMDREIIRAVEASVFAAGLPLDIGAALLIELDGLEAGIDVEAERVQSICIDYGARSCRLARDEAERKKLWAARKGAFGAVGRISPDSMIQDAVVPRSRLPEVLAGAYEISAKYQLRLANVFHAGDGNLHPFICFDSRSPDQVLRVKEAGRELMETCVRAGGTITGEHGVGLDKRDFLPLIFSPDDMDAMLRVRYAFDPAGLCNPGKIIPMLKGCGEARAVVRTTEQTETAGYGDAETRRRREAETLERGDADKRSVPIIHRQQHFNPDVAFSQLSAILGGTNVSVSPLLPVPASSSPALSVTPATVGEASEVMKLAASEGWKVMPAGAGTWLESEDAVVPINLILSTARLNQILDHEPADLVAGAQAGVTLTAFNQTLAQGGQWLPLDPPDDGRATIGGVVATGLGGRQQIGYGSPREFVIGMRVVLADGRVVKAGGRVVKNVAGYDLCKLFTGSYGTLGLITELTFKLRPRPAKEATLVAVGGLDTMLDAAWSVYKSSLFPVGLELLSAGIAQKIDLDVSFEKVVLLARFAGIEKTVDYQLESASALI
ncbi:MAG: FAD-binding protein, partial [bacterium]